MGWYTFALWYALTHSVTYIFAGSFTVIRVVLALLHICLILSLIFNRIVFVILAVILLAAIFLFTRWILSDMDDGPWTYKSAYRPKPATIFDGMSPEEAKKKYRQLMKECHPDNIGGDLEKAQTISAEYEMFQKANM